MRHCYIRTRNSNAVFDIMNITNFLYSMKLAQDPFFPHRIFFFFKQAVNSTIISDWLGSLVLSFNFSRTQFKLIVPLLVLSNFFPLKQIILESVYTLVGGNVLTCWSSQSQTTSVSPISTLVGWPSVTAIVLGDSSNTSIIKALS